MNLWERSKYAIAIIGSVLLVAVCYWISDEAFRIKYLERPAYKVAGLNTPDVDLGSLRLHWPQALGTPSDRAVLLGYLHNMPKEIPGPNAGGSVAPAAAAVEELPDFATAIPAASTPDGQRVAQRCEQCHDWAKNGPNKIGPNLYGIIGRRRAAHEGFSYSTAMIGKGGTWTYEDIFRYLKSPARFIPGNKMPFGGLPSAQDRLNLLAYMRTWADTPPPLPPSKPAQPTSGGGGKPTKLAPSP
jgi:cytochrome c